MISITNLTRGPHTLQLQSAHDALDAKTHDHAERVDMPDGSTGIVMRTLTLPPALHFGPLEKLGPFPDSVAEDPTVIAQKRAKLIRVDVVPAT